MSEPVIPEPRVQAVRVEWIDSASTHGWHDAVDLAREFAEQADGACAVCVTVALLWRVSEVSIELVQTSQPSRVHDGAYRVMNVIAIPRVSIRAIREL